MTQNTRETDARHLLEQMLLIRAYKQCIVDGGAAGRMPATCILVGRAAVAREGGDVTPISYGKTVPHRLEAPRELEGRGIAAEEAVSALKAPVLRLGGPDAPVASSYALEQAFVPQASAIAASAERLCSRQTTYS